MYLYASLLTGADVQVITLEYIFFSFYDFLIFFWSRYFCVKLAMEQGEDNGAPPVLGEGGVFRFGAAGSAGVVPRCEAHVYDVRNIKLPNFFRSDPRLWFTQAEIIFECYRIRSERQKAGVVISVLNYEIVQTMSDLLTMDPPDPALYTAIKKRIITNFSVSPEKELRAVLRGEIFADGKPSLILSKIRHLSRGRFSEKIIKAVFLKQLPENCRAILSMSEVEDVSWLAQVADRIMANSVSTENSVNVVSADNEILKKIEVLTERIDALSTQSHQQRSPRSRSRFRIKSGDRSRGRSRDDRFGGKCYYHFKFGENAEYCRPPCSYKEKLETKRNSKPDAEN